MADDVSRAPAGSLNGLSADDDRPFVREKARRRQRSSVARANHSKRRGT